eukprot:gene11992-12081_t
MIAALLGLTLGLGVTAAQAQSNPRYIQFQPLATKGALYVPDSGPAPTVAFLTIHRTSNFLSLIATRELAKRGFMVLGMNPRSDNNEASVNFERVALDIRQGIEFLRRQPGITKVVLIGHSGGGPATTFYQATAEQGVGFCQDPHKLTQCSDDLKDLPKADAMVLLDAHPGNTVNSMRSLNPSVLDEADPTKIDASLDPFDPKNGFNPAGQSVYSAEFMDRYFKAQAARMNRLIDKAQAMRAELKQGRGMTTDDAPFIVYRDRARLMDFSMSVHPGTVAPQKLIKNDGTVSVQIINSVRAPATQAAKQDKTLNGGTMFLTLTSFLSANAIRAKDSIDDIDWCSANNSTPCALKQISVPLLITAMGGHYFIRDNEIHYEVAASKDKDYVVAEGAVHGMTPCEACSKITGQSYGNVTKNLYDYIARWTNTRFKAARQGPAPEPAPADQRPSSCFIWNARSMIINVTAQPVMACGLPLGTPKTSTLRWRICAGPPSAPGLQQERPPMTFALLVLIKAAIATIIFTIGMGSAFSDVTYLWRRPALLLRSLLAMYVAVPLAAVLIASVVPMTAPVRIALLVLAVSSGAPLLPRKLGGFGDRAYVFSLLVTSSLVAIVVVPVSVSLLARQFGVAAEIGAVDVGVMLATAFLLPLLAGMIARVLVPARSDRLADRLLPIGGIVLTASSVILLGMNWEVFLQIRGPGVLALLLLIVAALAIGHCLGGQEPGQRTSLAIACATRHVGVAAVVASMIQGPRTLVLLAAYVATSALVSYPYLVCSPGAVHVLGLRMETKAPTPRAVLVGIQLDGIDDAAHESSLKELGRLVETLGYEVTGSVSQKRDGIGGLTVLGAGKLAELAAITGGKGVVGGWTAPKKSKARERFEGSKPDADDEEEEDASAVRPKFVILDHEISPSQARNLENATGASVLDRTGVIVEIFHRHARSREAKLQVEMARLRYVAPRLRESAVGGGGRQRGVGAGETNLDLDRRAIRDRLAELKEQLERVQRDNSQRRSARSDQLRVALVGYTNAGKSSLMRALTGSEVLVADQLFATLDTTVRALKPETKPRILVSDTVGFIKQLPHDLVASFRSTLDEALEASLLLFVVDASDPNYEAQLEVSRTVLREIGADVVPSLLLLNKMDRVEAEAAAELREKHPDAVMLSSKSAEDVSALHERIVAFFEGAMVEDELVLPYAKQGLLGEIYENARVLSEEFGGCLGRLRGCIGV